MELIAIELALKAFLKDSNKKHVTIFSDNTTAVKYINKQGGIKSLSCNEIAKKIWEFCIHNNTHISAAHIPGKHNILADLASRKFQDCAQWMLEPKIFDYVIRQFSRPEIDTLASTLTKQIPVYATWLPDPESSFIDAFAINWSNIFIYAFPPFSMIWRILQKIQQTGESLNGSFKKTKYVKFFRKMNIYQGVKNVPFSVNSRRFVFLKHPF